MYLLNAQIIFPPPEAAGKDGLLAVGGDLRSERLILGYENGIFPWYDEPPILWFSPDPRFVLFPDDFYISRSLKKTIRSGKFEVTFNRDFSGVIEGCSQNREEGTWLIGEMKEAYIRLHREGFAHSIEVWQKGNLVGGLYGVALGEVFCGESMFYRVADASKVALYSLVEKTREKNIRLIDSQVFTPHLEKMGARFISRGDYLHILQMGLAGKKDIRIPFP